VPKWLNQPEHRARIVAFAAARPQHGGSGALYVLLRRRRGEKN
jgi:DNA-nicking Smr family endonuclease